MIFLFQLYIQLYIRYKSTLMCRTFLRFGRPPLLTEDEVLRSEVLTAATMKMAVVWVVAL
jgi:hypothetical protein